MQYNLLLGRLGVIFTANTETPSVNPGFRIICGVEKKQTRGGLAVNTASKRRLKSTLPLTKRIGFRVQFQGYKGFPIKRSVAYARYN